MTDSITCPKCGRTSYNTNDIVHGWCGYCNARTSFQFPPPLTVSDLERISTLGDQLGVAKVPEQPRKGAVSRFVTQYRLCRGRELSRPLGVAHALRHAWRVTWH